MLNWQEIVNEIPESILKITPKIIADSDQFNMYIGDNATALYVINEDKSVSLRLSLSDVIADALGYVKAGTIIRHYSGGLTPGCDECADHFVNPENLDYDPFFSYSRCESPFHMGEQLGGDRYFVHAIYENNTYMHLTVCIECYEHLSDT